MSEITPYYIKILSNELESRKANDQKYSLRYFAKDIGMHVSTVSSVLRGLRPFPWRYAKSVAHRLNLSDPEIKQFIRSIHTEISDSDLEYGSKNAMEIDVEQHSRIIEEWEYYAILTYFETTKPSSHVEVIAQRFGLTEQRVQIVLAVLVECGFLKKDLKGLFYRSTDSIKTSEDISSETLRRGHLQELEIAKKKLETIEPALRDISSITFAADAEKIKQAKKLIRSFRSKLSNLMLTENSSEVYLLNIQLVPLTVVDHSEVVK